MYATFGFLCQMIMTCWHVATN